MSTEIKAIQKDVVHRICSGQVVLNLATAIKELVENSLDAGATVIDVRLKEFGSELIEVVDNGTGINPNNFQALGLKHHTSKLVDFSDLVDVETFGFRGEALSSLCAVSEMTVITRHESEKHGFELAFDYLGILRSKEPCARQVGTTVSLVNLFSSLPVRKKEFHRNLKKEFNKAVQLLSAYCLIAINVKITCVNQTKKNGKTTFLSTQGNRTIRDNISCVFGSKQLSTLLEIVNTTPNDEMLSEFGVEGHVCDSYVLQGYISSCEHGVGRSSTDRQFYFINGRPCEPSKIMKLVNEIYHQYNQHQFPFVLANILISKHMVDVNVTPDKRLLFLQKENFLCACVKSTLIRLFDNIPSTFKVNNPLRSLPPSNLASHHPPKLTLSTLDKWRHAKSQVTGTNGQKRCKADLERPTASKQMKLNFGDKRYDNSSSSSSSSSYLSDSYSDSRSLETEAYASRRAVLLETVKDAAAATAVEESSPFADSVANTEPVISNTAPDFIRVEIVDSDLPTKENSLSPRVSSDFVNDRQLKSTDVADGCESASAEKLVESNNREEVAEQQDARKNVSLCVSLRDIRRILDRNRKIRDRDGVISNKFYADIDPNKNHIAEEELSRAISKDMFLKMKIVGQFNMGFIIAKLENDLFIIDQHATDEKYNFETLQRTTSLNCQKLVIPQHLELTVTNECLLIDNIEIFRRNGFEFLVDWTAEATKRVKLISIPTSRNWQFGKEDIDEMLFMLQDAPNTLCRPSRIRAMFASRACRKSVMIGMPLNVADMKRLINHMSEIDHPWNCPHGRPTMRHLINLSMLD